MKKYIGIVVAILLSVVAIGTYGNIVHYNADRDVKVKVTCHVKEYVPIICCKGHSNIVYIINDTHGLQFPFIAIAVGNKLIDGKTLHAYVVPDYSQLPSGLHVKIEQNTKTIFPRTWRFFWGVIKTEDVQPGTYYVPIDVYAYWDGGSAKIESCSLKIVVFKSSCGCRCGCLRCDLNERSIKDFDE
ncbi:hypothetical protein [Archaeoglobus sp.]